MDPNLITALMMISAKTQNPSVRSEIAAYIASGGKTAISPTLKANVEPQLQAQGLTLGGGTQVPVPSVAPGTIGGSTPAPPAPTPPPGTGDNTDPYAPAQAGAQGMPSASDIQSAVNSVLPPTSTPNNGVTPGVDPGREQNRTAATPAPGAGLPSTPPPATPPMQQQSSGNGIPTPTTNTGGTGMSVGGANPSGGSAASQAGYAQAMQGDQTALNAVLSQVLGKLGVDVTRPGLYTKGLVDEVSPYLTTFLRYFGLSDGKPALDRAKQAADQFGNMLGSDNTFGQIQDYGKQVLGGIGGLIGGDGITPQRQMGMTNDLLGLLTAGNNDISQAASQGALAANQNRYSVAALDQPNLRYNDFLKGSAASDPQLAMLAQLFR